MRFQTLNFALSVLKHKGLNQGLLKSFLISFLTILQADKNVPAAAGKPAAPAEVPAAKADKSKKK